MTTLDGVKAPCYMCGKRHVGCHASCPDYQAWHQQREEINRKQKQWNDIKNLDGEHFLREQKSKWRWKRQNKKR